VTTKSPERGQTDRTNAAARDSIITDENIRAVAALHERAARKRTTVQRISDDVSRRIAGESVVVVHLIWFVA
jgi:hypothetical protein